MVDGESWCVKASVRRASEKRGNAPRSLAARDALREGRNDFC